MFKTFAGLTVFALMAATQAALADDWTGQTPPPPVNGTNGPFTSLNGLGMASTQIILRCQPGNTPPPCAGGSTLQYTFGTAATTVSSLPAAAGPGSGVGVNINGAYSDPTSPTGISYINGTVPLEAFARSDTVDALTGTVGGLTTTVGGLNTAVGGLNTAVGSLQGNVSALNASVGVLSTQLSSLSIRFDQFQQQVHMEEQDLRQGVAMSLAMDGVGDLGPDEKVAISMNVGTYGGQNGIAAGVAFRAAQHLTFNAGIGTGVHGGLVGGRAGVRMAW